VTNAFGAGGLPSVPLPILVKIRISILDIASLKANEGRSVDPISDGSPEGLQAHWGWAQILVGPRLRRVLKRGNALASVPVFTDSCCLEGFMVVAPPTTVNVRYMVNDVDAAIAWYTKHLSFTVLTNAAPAFADVTLGSLRLLLSGPTSSAGRAMPDGARPEAGGWNRVHLVVDDLPGEVARLRAAGVQFRNDIVTGPGGSQILLRDPSGNLVELFQPARH
jgi:catechol 2,3-dioxygenase-like lactoylglutathione lyase family enzyme